MVISMVGSALLLGAMSPMANALEIPGFLKGAAGAVAEPPSPWEKTYKFRLFRMDAEFTPVDFKIEALLLVLAAAYLCMHFVGKARNHTLAQRWIKAALPMLEDEFAYVAKEQEKEGHEPAQGEGCAKLAWNGDNTALGYASGRRGVDGLRILFELVPYHDPIELLYNYAVETATSAPSGISGDSISLTFLLPYQTPDNISGVFAIVDKASLRASRRGRFDLSFAKVLDGEQVNEQRQLDNRFAIMSETGELTDAFLGEVGERGNAVRHRIGLQAALNSAAGKYLYSLVLSDQPERRPEEGAIPIEKRARRLVLTMRVPRSGLQAQESLALLEAACNLVDALELQHARLTNSAVAKLRNARVAIDKELNEEATRWRKEEEEEAKQEAKRKAEKEKFDKLTPAEQEKRRQLEKKRAQRKAQGKGGMKAR